jgi:hypothetical protein
MEHNTSFLFWFITRLVKLPNYWCFSLLTTMLITIDHFDIELFYRINAASGVIWRKEHYLLALNVL